MTEQNGFWPDGARLAVSVSMQFEAGGQPVSGAGGPITEPILPGFPDLGQNSFYEYGAREGVPRILDLLDKHAIKMTSFMIGDAVRRHPDVAAEIVRRGHEAGAHGRSWQRQYQLPRPQETEWIANSVHAIEQATGTRPSGYNNYWTAAETSRPAVLQDVRPADDGEPHHIFITHSDRIAHNLRSVSADLRCRETLGVYRERRADRDVLRGAVLLDCACQDGWPG